MLRNIQKHNTISDLLNFYVANSKRATPVPVKPIQRRFSHQHGLPNPQIAQQQAQMLGTHQIFM